MVGGVLACLGMVASSFSHTLSQLYIAAGFFTGDCLPIRRAAGRLLKSARLKGDRAGKAREPMREQGDGKVHRKGCI